MVEARSPKALVLIPDLRVKGGVTYYYATLGLNREEGVDYFSVNRHDSVGTFQKIRGLPKIYWRFLRQLRRYDLVHVNPSLEPKSYFRDAMFILFARLLRKPCLVFFRGWSEAYEQVIHRRPHLRWIFRHTYARASLYVVLGKVFAERLRRLGIDPSAPVVIETTVGGVQGLSSGALERKLEGRRTGLHILFLSRILRRKGVVIALDAFAQCRAAHPDVPMHFWVAGEGEFLEEARSYAQTHGHDAVTFLGNVEGAEKEELLRKCHVLLFPTYYGEGLPNAILECMLNGMVVVSRPAGGIGEVVEHGVHGYLSTSVESRVFAGFLGALIEDQELMARMARTNLETALQRFTADHVRERILSLYRVVLTDRDFGQPVESPPSGVLPATVNEPIENHNT